MTWVDVPRYVLMYTMLSFSVYMLYILRHELNYDMVSISRYDSMHCAKCVSVFYDELLFIMAWVITTAWVNLYHDICLSVYYDICLSVYYDMS